MKKNEVNAEVKNVETIVTNEVVNEVKEVASVTEVIDSLADEIAANKEQPKKDKEPNNVETMKLSEAKKVINNEFNAEFVTPFKVLNFVNKNRSKEAYKVVFEKFLIQDENGKQRKLNLDDLLKVTENDADGKPLDTFCRLSSVDKKEQSLSTFVDKDGKTWYFIPVPFSVNGFFASIQGLYSYRKKVAALKSWNDDATKRAEHEKKQRAKLQNKVKELKENPSYNGLSEAQITLIAREITGVRIVL